MMRDLTCFGDASVQIADAVSSSSSSGTGGGRGRNPGSRCDEQHECENSSWSHTVRSQFRVPLKLKLEKKQLLFVAQAQKVELPATTATSVPSSDQSVGVYACMDGWIPLP